MPKYKWLYAVIILTLSFTFFPAHQVDAQSATVNFSTSITYQNIGTAVAHPTILFYQEGSTKPITIARPDLAVGASATVSVGSLSTGSTGFKGSAVVKSDVPLAVLMTQIPDTSTVKSRPMATGSSSGLADFWSLEIQKTTDVTSISVQNVDSKENDITMTFYGSGTPVTITKTKIPSGGSVFLKTTDIAELTAASYYAIHITSTRTGTTTAGKIIGVQMLWSGNPATNTAIEGLSQSGKKLFMPYAMCSSTAGMTTSYYIFNTDPTTSTSVKVSYNSGKSETKTLAPLKGGWFNACTPSKTVAGFSGYATVTSTNTAVLAQGLIKNGGVNTRFFGQTVGTSRLAVPLANYSASQYSTQVRQQTSIAIMNLGSALAANTVKILYYDKNGILVGTHSLGAIGAGGKATSSPASVGAAGNEFGYYSDGTTGGSAIIQGPAGSNLMATVYVSSVTGKNTYTGEIYNAIPAITD